MTPKQWLKENPEKGINDYYVWQRENQSMGFDDSSIPSQRFVSAKKNNVYIIIGVALLSLLGFYLPWVQIDEGLLAISAYEMPEFVKSADNLNNQSSGQLFIIFYLIPISAIIIILGTVFKLWNIVLLSQMFYSIFTVFLTVAVVVAFRGETEVGWMSVFSYGFYISIACAFYFIFSPVKSKYMG